MRSSEVASEIDYAICLRRPNFILPTYWEEPLPRNPAEGLPPQEIDRLYFYRIYPGALTQIPIGETVAGRSGAMTFGGAADALTVAAPVARPTEVALPAQTAPWPTPESIRTPAPPQVYAPQVYAPQLSTPATESAPRQRRWGLTPVLGAVALVLLAVGLTPIWFMMSSRSSLSSRSASANSNSNRLTPTASTPETTMASHGQKIGVPECDDFIAKYDACVSSKVPEAARAQYQKALGQWRESWQKLAENPQSRARLASACKQAAEQQAAALKTYGCAF